MLSLNVCDLTCSRGGRALVSGLNFSLEQGAWLHLKGRNGAGKSTLLRTLAGLHLPRGGQVNWGGASTHQPPAVMLMGHQAAVKREFTPRESLRWGIPGDSRNHDDARTESALTRVGLQERMDLPVRFLSEGQKRRLLMARLLLQPALLWLLDEPLNGLDGEGVNLLGALVEEHLAGGGMAVITSHQPLPLTGGKVLCL